MNKLLKPIICAALAASLTGCAQPDERTVDEKFVDSLTEGLEARWTLTDASGDDYTTDQFNKYLEAELNKIESYKNEKFENKQLKEQADLYIDSLEQTKDITKYIDEDVAQFNQMYSPIYSQRILALQEINNIDSLEFQNADDQKSLDDMLDEAKLIKSVTDLTKSIHFEKTNEDDDPEYDIYSADYIAKVKNDTSYSFDYYNLTINLLDKDGVVLEQTYAGVNPWKKDETQRLKFSVFEKISDIQIVSVDYSLSNNTQSGTIDFI